MARLVQNVTELIGDTPLVKLNRVVPEGSAEIYVKLEFQNPGASVKDRIAISMINVAEQEGRIKPGDTIVPPQDNGCEAIRSLPYARPGSMC